MNEINKSSLTSSNFLVFSCPPNVDLSPKYCACSLYLFLLSEVRVSLLLWIFLSFVLWSFPPASKILRLWRNERDSCFTPRLLAEEGRWGREGRQAGWICYSACGLTLVFLACNWHSRNALTLLAQSNCCEQINYASSQCVWLWGTWREGFSFVFLATRFSNGCFPDQRMSVLGSCGHLGLSVWWQACSLADSHKLPVVLLIL